MNDDELEADLRRVLGDPRHRLPDSLVPLDGVHAGARRRKARRQAVAATVAATAGVLGVVAFVGINHLVRGTGSPTVAAATGPTGVIASSPGYAPSPVPATTTPTSPLGSALSKPSLPADFTPVSVTAINRNDWWVLGRGGAIISTTDGGASFYPVSEADASGLPTAVTEIRFNTDGRHGWAVSQSGGSTGSLWKTSDGGSTWSAVQLKGGVVVSVELGGTAGYALVREGKDAWAVWETAANGTGDWQRLWSLGSLPSEPLLAVTAGKAVVASTGAGTIRTWVVSPGAQTSATQPCDVSTGATSISATGGGVWLSCSTGTADGIWRSDDGSLWASVPAGAEASRMTVGAITPASAAVGKADGQIYVITASGSITQAAVPSGRGGQWTYIAFTNKSAGFAIDDTGRMLRTNDGGMSWTQISFQ